MESLDKIAYSNVTWREIRNETLAYIAKKRASSSARDDAYDLEKRLKNHNLLPFHLNASNRIDAFDMLNENLKDSILNLAFKASKSVKDKVIPSDIQLRRLEAKGKISFLQDLANAICDSLKVGRCKVKHDGIGAGGTFPAWYYNGEIGLSKSILITPRRDFLHVFLHELGHHIAAETKGDILKKIQSYTKNNPESKKKGINYVADQVGIVMPYQIACLIGGLDNIYFQGESHESNTIDSNRKSDNEMKLDNIIDDFYQEDEMSISEQVEDYLSETENQDLYFLQLEEVLVEAFARLCTAKVLSKQSISPNL